MPASSGRFQILSLDGGGLKGLFTARFLEEWEKETGKPVVSSFDLIAGSSAGGIIALALGAKIPAAKIVEFFRDHGPEIFPEEPIEALGKARQATGSRYSPKALEEALDCYFNGRTLGDSCVRLMIPAYHVGRGIHIYKTAHHSRLLTDHRTRMADVARATAAAPTILPPHTAMPGLRLIDGGVWANNPVQIAVNEALGYLGQPQCRIVAVRVGTTAEVLSDSDYPADPGGFGNLKMFVDLMMRGQSQAASGGVRQILGRERFIEIDPQVPKEEYRTDRLAEGLLGRAVSEFRSVVSDLGEGGFIDHCAPPFIPPTKRGNHHGTHQVTHA